MRELDTGSAYRVQFKTSAHHHTLSDMHELVQNHEQELKAHAAVMKQAAERQTQLNAQLQMLYDTRMVTRVTSSQMDDLLLEHEAEQQRHDEKIARAKTHKENLDAYGHQLKEAAQSEKEQKEAEEQHAAALEAARVRKEISEKAAAQHKKNFDLLRKPEKPVNPAKPPKPDNKSPPRQTYSFAVTHGPQRNTEEVKILDPFRKRDHPSRA